MRRTLTILLAAFLIASLAAPAARAGGMAAQDAFDQLKTLAGTWRGMPAGEGEEAKAEAEAEAAGQVMHEVRVSAAGSVVMETMNPGTDHEMINMYHLDGEDLLLTHYCASGNQPQMKLNRESSTAETLVFDFVGGTNLDPEVDQHIHSARISVLDADHVDSAWTGYVDGEEAGVMTFHLARE